MLETKRLILRPWELADVIDLYTYAKDPQVGPMAGWPPHKSLEDSTCILKSVLSAPYTYAIVLKDTMQAIGSIGLMIGKASDIARNEQEAEIGYWIGVPHQGKGLMSEAVTHLITYAFEELAMQRLWCGYFEGNDKSKRVQEKCGFTYDHIIHNKEVILLQTIRNEVVTTLSKAQWVSNRKKTC